MFSYNRMYEFLNFGLTSRAYPCYAAAVGTASETLFVATGGNRAVYPQRLPLEREHLFDMASMTKIIGTNCAALRLIDRGVLRLDDTLDRYFERCEG